MILLNRIDPEDNMNRWYLVSVQATLFSPCAVIIAWGRRDNGFQQWRALPVDNRDRAQELADRIVTMKVKRGYQVRSIYFE